MKRIIFFTKTNESKQALRSDINSVLLNLASKNHVFIYDNKKCLFIDFNQKKEKSYKIKFLSSTRLYSISNFISFFIFLQMNKGEFDEIQINYIREEYLFFPRLLKKLGKRMHLLVYGSDFYHRNWMRDRFNSIFYYADSINFTNPTVLRAFNVFYNYKYEPKLNILDLPFEHFDLYRDFSLQEKINAKQQLGIEKNKIVLAIGTNAFPFEQHEKIIIELEKLSNKNEYHLIFVFSYIGSDLSNRCSYLDQLVSEKLFEFTFSIYKGYLSYSQISSIRLATDCLINLRKTDQLVLSMLESNLAFSYIITGNWLPYDDYLQNVNANIIGEFSELCNSIEEITSIIKKGEGQLILLNNRNYILKRYSVTNAIQKWHCLYD